MELKTLFFFEFSVAESEHFFWKLMGVTCHCFLLLIFSRRSKGHPVFDWLFLRCFQLEKGEKEAPTSANAHPWCGVTVSASPARQRWGSGCAFPCQAAWLEYPLLLHE